MLCKGRATLVVKNCMRNLVGWSKMFLKKVSKRQELFSQKKKLSLFNWLISDEFHWRYHKRDSLSLISVITKSSRNTSALDLAIKSCFRPLPTSSVQDLLSLKANAHVLERIKGGVLQEFNILISVIVEKTDKAFRTRRTVDLASEGRERWVYNARSSAFERYYSRTSPKRPSWGQKKVAVTAR